MFKLNSKPGDDPQFLEKIERVLGNIFRQGNTERYIVCRVDNWFDHKWLGFSGKAIGVVGFWKGKRLTVPPFTPNRILEERHFSKQGSEFIESEDFKSIHAKQTSADNLYRYIDRVVGPSTLAWFSSETEKNGRGSLMVYTVISESAQRAWYVSFNKNRDGNWSYGKSLGISVSQLKEMES